MSDFEVVIRCVLFVIILSFFSWVLYSVLKSAIRDGLCEFKELEEKKIEKANEERLVLEEKERLEMEAIIEEIF